MMIFITLLLQCLVVFLLTYCLVAHLLGLQKLTARKLTSVPGPSAWEASRLIWRYFFVPYEKESIERHQTKSNQMVYKLAEKYGDHRGVVKMAFLLSSPYLFIFEEKLAKKILAHPDFQNKAEISRVLGHVIASKGIFTCDGPTAKSYRLELRRHLFTRPLESYISKFSGNLAILEGKIEQIIDSPERQGVLEDIQPTISALVLDQVGDSLFSIQFNAQSRGELPPFIGALDVIMLEMNWFMVEQWKTNGNFLSRLFFLPFLIVWKLLRLLKSVLQFRLSVLRMVLTLYWRAVYRRKNEHEFDDNLLDKPSSMMEAVVERRVSYALSSWFSLSSVLSLVTTAYQQFKEANYHLTMFTLAGHQTTTSSLTWTLYYLCKDEKVKQKLQAEIDDFTEQATPLSDILTDKSVLRYLDAVIRESLRLAPAAGYLGRQATADVQLPVSSGKNSTGNKKEEEEEEQFISIPKGTNMGILVQYMHYSERYYRKAGEFIPERWLPKTADDDGDDKEEMETTTDTTSCYFPFSAGNRACFGEKYALLQMKVTLLSICSKFDFTFAHPKTFCQPRHYLAQAPASFAIKFSRRRRDG